MVIFLKTFTKFIQFKKSLISDKNKYLKSIITKLMQINLYAQLFHDSYNGPFLPPQIDAANYTAVKFFLINYKNFS